MPRPFSAAELRLPRLRATGALALTKQLLDAAADHALPAHVKTAMAQMSDDRLALREALGLSTETVEAPGVRDADIAEDGAWGILRDWLAVWARLPGEAGDQARRLLAVIFGQDGMAFTQLPVEEELEAADAKLGVIGKKKLAPVIKELGGQLILQHLEAVHEKYAEAIAAAARAQAREEGPGVREPMGQLLDAMQTYITRVAGLVERGKPESRALAEKLLAPLISWDRSQSPSSPEAPVAPGGEPAKPTS